MPARGWRKVTVRLPECIVECLAEAYREPASTAVRRLIMDLLAGRTVYLPDECQECIDNATKEAG